MLFLQTATNKPTEFTFKKSGHYWLKIRTVKLLNFQSAFAKPMLSLLISHKKNSP